METSPSYCRHLRFRRFQKSKLFWQKIKNKNLEVFIDEFLHILIVVLVLSELLQWVTGTCVEAVSRASFGEWGQCRTSSVVLDSGISVLQSGSAVTTLWDRHILSL